ncbi:hypothetical protein [Streptomyces sp. NPDC001985]|uniref:hypothetical protein n=1 Tax=Streptomyces sp. NPDC001985 TaxID=3154406 RepID=UPI00331C19DD
MDDTTPAPARKIHWFPDLLAAVSVLALECVCLLALWAWALTSATSSPAASSGPAATGTLLVIAFSVATASAVLAALGFLRARMPVSGVSQILVAGFLLLFTLGLLR